MKEIHNIMSRFLSMIDERIILASSNQSLFAYQVVKNNFCMLFKDFIKDDIVISKKEYRELLEDKLIILNDDYNKFEFDDEEYENKKKEIKEKIDYLDLI